MQNTTNYNLNKPDGNDFAKIQALNDNADIIDATLKSLADISLDFEYQVPTIVGEQIQLTKNSNTKRLFIRLNNALSGNVTVSLDGGATSKPLLDVDGNQVTSIDKGFAEVVEDTTFFTLRNRGVSATDLRELIDLVNEAERNESVLKGQFATAVNEVDLYGGINLPTDATWANILAEIPNIKTNMKTARGTIFTNPVNVLYINGLDFVPSIIVGVLSVTGNPSSYFVLHLDGNGTSITKNQGVTHISTVSVNTLNDITNISFTSTAQAIYTSANFIWIAYE